MATKKKNPVSLRALVDDDVGHAYHYAEAPPTARVPRSSTWRASRRTLGGLRRAPRNCSSLFHLDEALDLLDEARSI